MGGFGFLWYSGLALYFHLLGSCLLGGMAGTHFRPHSQQAKKTIVKFAELAAQSSWWAFNAPPADHDRMRAFLITGLSGASLEAFSAPLSPAGATPRSYTTNFAICLHKSQAKHLLGRVRLKVAF
jgi:hypothetical protein